MNFEDSLYWRIRLGIYESQNSKNEPQKFSWQSRLCPSYDRRPVERKVAASTQNQALSALLFLYSRVLKLKITIDAVRAKTPERLPVVLSVSEVKMILNEIPEGPYRLIAGLTVTSYLNILILILGEYLLMGSNVVFAAPNNLASDMASVSKSLVPLPQSVEAASGRFVLTEKTVVWCSKSMESDGVAAEDLVHSVKSLTGLKLTVRHLSNNDVPTEGIILGDSHHSPTLVEAVKQSVPDKPQGYRLTVSPTRILICGSDPAGTYYGTRTLSQLVAKVGEQFIVPGVTIQDWPDFLWRGGMNYRFGPVDGKYDSLQEFIDQCASVKMNILYVSDFMVHFDEPLPDGSASKARQNNLNFKAVIDYARARHMKIIVCSGGGKFPQIYRCDRPETRIYFFPDAEGERLCVRRLEELIDLVRPDVISIGQDEIITAYPPHLRQPVLEGPIVGRPAVPPKGKYANRKPHEVWSDFLWFYRNLLKKHGVELALWGDCLITPEEMVGKPVSQNDGTYGGLPDNLYLARATAPKDILLFDWHYAATWAYPSVDILAKHEFSLLAGPWFEPTNIFFFCKYLKEQGGTSARGLFNTWWDNEPIDPFLPFMADCAWSGGKSAHAPAYLKNLISLAELAKKQPLRHLPEGNFHWDLSLHIEEGGYFFSDGSYICFPQREGGTRSGKSIGLALKPGAKGFIDYTFAAEKGTFKSVILRPWFKNVGTNGILLRTSESADWVMVEENKNWSGADINLGKYVRGKQKFHLRFEMEADKTLKGRVGSLTRFIILGNISSIKE